MFVVFDLETTGLSEATGDVIEFSYAMFDDNNSFIKAEQLFFYHKGMSWSDEAYRVHKIPLDFLAKHEDKFKENLVKMYSVLNRANVIGHNAIAFDCPFAKTWLMRQGIRNLEYGVMQDTMVAFRPKTNKNRISLSKLADFCGIGDSAINMFIEQWFPNLEGKHLHSGAYDVTLTALITFRGLAQNLIRFEPLFKSDVDLSSNDMSSMYSEGTTVLDPDRFIVHLKSSNGVTGYHYVNHDYAKYADITPIPMDVTNFRKQNKLLPITLVEESPSVFSAAYGSATYKLIVDKSSRDVLVVHLPIGDFNDTELPMDKIIANNFNGVEELEEDV